ncbi:MAG: leucine-rich repeat domain-containing protein, partial [Planctomycetaceae bacterium]|nr:leucine-rich repeat domain-containing protein [Planctomycetaceae bacterium]
MTDFEYTEYEDHIRIRKYTGSASDVTIPSTINGLPVTSISNGTFSCHPRLNSVTIPKSVTHIGRGAFCRDTLTSVTIPNSVKCIGKNTFCGCESLTSVTIPNSVTSIGKYAFYECISLTSVTIPESVTSIGRSAFSSCYGLTAVTIPNSVTSIGNDAFFGCRRLTIYGTEGSAAQTYAEGHNIPFSTGPLPYCDAAGFYYSHDGK